MSKRNISLNCKLNFKKPGEKCEYRRRNMLWDAFETHGSYMMVAKVLVSINVYTTHILVEVLVKFMPYGKFIAQNSNLSALHKDINYQWENINKYNRPKRWVCIVLSKSNV